MPQVKHAIEPYCIKYQDNIKYIYFPFLNWMINAFEKNYTKESIEQKAGALYFDIKSKYILAFNGEKWIKLAKGRKYAATNP